MPSNARDSLCEILSPSETKLRTFLFHTTASPTPFQILHDKFILFRFFQLLQKHAGSGQGSGCLTFIVFLHDQDVYIITIFVHIFSHKFRVKTDNEYTIS